MLKPFKEEDLAIYLTLSDEFYSSEATDHPVPQEHFRQTFKAVVSGSPLARGWLIEDEGQIVGYCLASLTWSNEFGGKVAWLEELYLKQQTRGKGLGRRVFERLIDKLKLEEQVAGFRLEVTPANKSVASLYESAGFSWAPYLEMWRTA